MAHDIALQSFRAALCSEGVECSDEEFEMAVCCNKIPLKHMERHSLYDVGLLSYISALEPYDVSRREAVIRYLRACDLSTDPGRIDAANMQACRLITWRNKL